ADVTSRLRHVRYSPQSGHSSARFARWSSALKRQEVEAVRRMTPEPFGVNLIPAATDSELLEQQLRMCIELGGEERSLPNPHRC
ncbi:MAG: hypothetical protein WBE50_08240, partial [Methyloceanibacter sp.]